MKAVVLLLGTGGLGAVHHDLGTRSTVTCECEGTDFYKALYCLQINDLLGTCPDMNVIDVLTFDGESACGTRDAGVTTLEMALDLALNFQTTEFRFVSDKACVADAGAASAPLQVSFGLPTKCDAQTPPVDFLTLDPNNMKLSWNETTQEQVIEYTYSPLLPALTLGGSVVRIKINADCVASTDPATMSLANYYVPIRPRLDTICALGDAVNNLFGGSDSAPAALTAAAGAAVTVVFFLS